MAIPRKSLDLDDISAQLMLEGCQYNVLFSYTLFNEEAPFYEQFGRGGTILLVILERRLVDVFIHVQNYAGVGWSFILWSMLYLEGGHLDRVTLFVWPEYSSFTAAHFFQFAIGCARESIRMTHMCWCSFSTIDFTKTCHF